MDEAQPQRQRGFHIPHPHLDFRKKQGVPTIAKEHTGFNGWLAVNITNLVATMWCAYLFAILALISLPDAIKAGTPALVAWIAQTFLQLVLLEISNDVHKLLKQNNDLTEEIHAALAKVTAKEA